MNIIIGIDASRCRSGGAIAHIVGILDSFMPVDFGVKEVHLWSFNSLLNKVEDKPWLVKHNPTFLEKSLLHQIWWQGFYLSTELKINNCDILFTADASTFCRFKPMVVFSQDMLPYEPGAMRQFGYNYARLRLILLFFIQTLPSSMQTELSF